VPLELIFCISAEEQSNLYTIRCRNRGVGRASSSAPFISIEASQRKSNRWSPVPLERRIFYYFLLRIISGRKNAHSCAVLQIINRSSAGNV